MKKSYLFTIILLLFGYCQNLTSQFEKLFLNEADKDIKEVICYEILDGDSSIYSRTTYNKQGLVVSENQPDYHIHQNYKYDKNGRLIEKEALYGESFANGIVKYEYNDKVRIAENDAMGFYLVEIERYNDAGNDEIKETYYIAAGMGESKVQKRYFYYDISGKLLKIMYLTEYLDIKKEVGSLVDSKNKAGLLRELLSAPLIRKEQGVETYSYNKNGQLYRRLYTNLNTNISEWEKTYLLNLDGLIGFETHYFWNSESLEKEPANEKYTKSFHYNNEKKLERIEENNGDVIITKYYISDKLVEIKESRNQGESVTKYHFYYKYYN